MIYGYAHLSTDGQSVYSQMEQLRAAGAEKVYREKRADGARADRVQLRRVLAQLGKGDVLTVTRLDHLARSTRDLLNTLAAITDTGAGFRSLSDTWADTTTHDIVSLAVFLTSACQNVAGSSISAERPWLAEGCQNREAAIQKMSAKIPQSHDALRRHLAEQIAFLEASAASFDAGFEGEAKRLAVAIRVLVHDTHVSHSLMEQLGTKDRDFVDTSFGFDPKNHLSHGGLVAAVLGPSGVRNVAMLDDAPAFKKVAFDVWWDKPVFVDQGRRTLTRKDVVLIAANQDGGAHVDPALDARYAELAERLGWVAIENGVARTMEGAERAAIRQIAHELLKTLVPDYSKKMPAHEGVILVQPALEVASQSLPHASVAPRKMRGNEPCFCGSNLRYKRCHGRSA